MSCIFSLRLGRKTVMFAYKSVQTADKLLTILPTDIIHGIIEPLSKYWQIKYPILFANQE